MTKKVLIIARVFPPFLPVGHSIRVIKFIKYLPAYSWLPVVLTVDDQKEYENNLKVGSEVLLTEIKPEVKIYRTSAGEPTLDFLEKERQFGLRNSLAAVIVSVVSATRRWAFRNIVLPDRNLAWLPFAVRKGRQLVKNAGIDIIFATCPPYSASIIGVVLKLFTGKPLILDFRDDWVDTPWHHSRPMMIQMIERKLESWAVKTADKVILVTEWSKSAFINRYPTQPCDKFILISNGCDLEEFQVLNSMPVLPRNSKFTIIHTGTLYASQGWTRSPITFFEALHRILNQQPELADDLTVLFAGEFPEGYRRAAEELGLSKMVKGVGHLQHEKVLRLAKSADLLLALGTEGMSSVIPGKIYEYWAVGGPAILLVSCPGAATNFIEANGLGLAVESTDVTGIQQAILKVYRQSKTATPLRVSSNGIEAYDRRALTQQLTKVFSMVVADKGSPGPIETISVRNETK